MNPQFHTDASPEGAQRRAVMFLRQLSPAAIEGAAKDMSHMLKVSAASTDAGAMQRTEAYAGLLMLLEAIKAEG